VRQNLGSPGCN